MRVTRLVENKFMGVDVMDITPSKTLTVLRGPNGEGKTSALRGLISALGGAGFDPDVPINSGSEGADVTVHLSEEAEEALKVSVKWTQKGRYLTVTATDPDSPYGSGKQGLLDAMIGPIAFNPLALMAAKPAEQMKLLMVAMGKEEEYEKFLQTYKASGEKRRDLNRDIKQLESREPLYRDVPDEVMTPISEAELMERIHTANKQTQDIESCKNRIESLKATIAQATAALKIEQAKLQKLPEPEAVTEEELAEVRRHNEMCQKQKAKRELDLLLGKRRKESETLTKKMEDLRQGLVEDIQAKLGEEIEGVSFNDEFELEFNGKPLAQASGREQLHIAALIGMIGNPTIKLMCIDEGDRLDQESLQALVELAEKYDYQLMMTAVYAGDGVEGAEVVDVKGGRIVPKSKPPVKPPVKPTGRRT